jgi:hypothetical protein
VLFSNCQKLSCMSSSESNSLVLFKIEFLQIQFK